MLTLHGYEVVITQERFETKIRRNRSGSHPFVHWLARWLPIDPYVEWDWPEQAPCDDALLVGGKLFVSARVFDAIKRQILAAPIT